MSTSDKKTPKRQDEDQRKEQKTLDTGSHEVDPSYAASTAGGIAGLVAFIGEPAEAAPLVSDEQSMATSGDGVVAPESHFVGEPVPQAAGREGDEEYFEADGPPLAPTLESGGVGSFGAPAPQDFASDTPETSSMGAAAIADETAPAPLPRASSGIVHPEPPGDGPAAAKWTPEGPLAATVAEDLGDGGVVMVLDQFDQYGEPIVYVLTDEDGNALTDSPFVIDGHIVKLAPGSDLDFEGAAESTIFITATNEGGVSGPWPVELTVADVAEDILLEDGGVTFVDIGVAETSISGGDGADRITAHDDGGALSGGGGSDGLTGGTGHDILDGGAGLDTLSSGTGDDTLVGGAGDDALDGGAGADVAVFSGSWADYSITETGGVYTIVDTRPGSPDGTDTVTNVELFRFADGDVAVGDLLNVGPSVSAVDGAIDENTAGATVGAISAVDGNAGDSVTLSVDDARFEIVGGELKLKDGESLDFEADGASVSVTVTATDLHGATDTQVVTVTVGDVAESLDVAGSFTDTGVAETALIGGAGHDTITAHDDGGRIDGGGGADALTGGTGDDTIEGGTGDDTLDGGAGADTALYGGNRSDYAITESGGVYVITDTRPGSPDGTDTVTDVELFRFADGDVAVADLLNVGPSLSVADGAIDESAAGATVGAVSASDANGWDNVTLTVDDARFEVVDGELRLKDGESLNYEADGSTVSVTVTATDSLGASATQVVTVTVEDVAEDLNVSGSFTDFGVAETSITGGVLDDTITAHDDGSAVQGGDGNDLLTGGDGDDVIDGGDHSDTLVGGAGNDYIDAGEDRNIGDDDQLFGGSGNDTLVSTETDSRSNDAFYGEDGNDSISSMGGGDTLDGGSGNDTLSSGTGDDVLVGGADDDTLDGGDGIDTAIYSGAREDFAIAYDAGTGTFTITDLAAADGDEGTDSVTGVEQFTFDGVTYTASELANSAPTAVILEANPSFASVGDVVATVTDVVDADASDTHTFSLADDAGGTFAIDTDTGEISLLSDPRGGADYQGSVTVRVTDTHGGSHDQTFGVTLGTSGNDNVEGTSGGDLIFVTDGQNRVSGGSGDDTIIGGAGTDVEGVANFAWTEASNGDSFHGTTGVDYFSFAAGSGSYATVRLNDTPSEAGGSDGVTDYVRIETTESASLTIGDFDLADDKIVLQEAYDWIGSYSGDGYVYVEIDYAGGTTQDFMIWHSGGTFDASTVFATDGPISVPTVSSDTAVYDGVLSDFDVTYDALSGAFTITDANPDDGDEGSDTVLNVEAFEFGGETYLASDLIDIAESAGAAPATAEAPPATPYEDWISGGAGADVLQGLAGDDTLNGMGGDDVLDGGTGDDVLSGGDGNDYFRFAAGEGSDVVDGGTGWTDAISLEGMGAGATQSGNTIDGNGWTMALDSGDSVSSLTLDSVELSPDASGTIAFDNGGLIDFTAIERIEF